MEAFKAPIVTVCQLRQVKAFLLNLRALIVGIVWTGVADIRTPPLRYPQGQICALSCRNGSYSQGPPDEPVQPQKAKEEQFPSSWARLY